MQWVGGCPLPDTAHARRAARSAKEFPAARPSDVAEREEQIQDRERKQDVGVRKHRSHGGLRSVRQVGVVDDRCNPLPPGTATFTAHLELDDVGEADAAMTTPG